MKTVFITGVSSGIGSALAQRYLDTNWRVFGVSRRACDIEHPNLTTIGFDLCDLDHYGQLNTLFATVTQLDLVVLNAGILGDIKDLQESPTEALKAVMEINLWANKQLIDYLIRRKIRIKQIVAISSGAAVNGSRGWSGYALSKAALNMLISLYAKEMPDTHLSALAPGLILTPMLEQIINEADEEKFPSVTRLKASEKRTPAEAAELLYDTFEKLLVYESGSFVDVRSM